MSSSNTSCISNCIAKHNNGTNTGRGIFLLDCFDCVVEDNLVVGNVGGSTGIGIEVSNTGGAGVLSTGVFGNKSQAHVSNFITVPGTILRVLYTRSTGLAIPSAVPTDFDNIDIS